VKAKPCKDCGTCPTCGRGPAPIPMPPTIIILQPAPAAVPMLPMPWYVTPFQPLVVTCETFTWGATGGPNAIGDLGNGYRPVWGQAVS
jgi:hypothetical protein